MSNFRLRVLSLGAGVQSSTLALMAAKGLIGPGGRAHPQQSVLPDFAVFADTGAQPAAVYRHLDWLEGVLPFPVRRVQAPFGPLGEAVIGAYQAAHPGRAPSPPFFTANPDGMLPRQCTKEAKVRPIAAEVRRELGVEPGKRVAAGIEVEQWIGISTDESQRMKPAENPWITNRWPLIEADMSRQRCLRWLEERGYPRPPKSACIWCPYHSEEGWREIKASPED